MTYTVEGLSRREFVRTVSAGLALLPALGTSGLARAIGPRRTRVAVARRTAGVG